MLLGMNNFVPVLMLLYVHRHKSLSQESYMPVLVGIFLFCAVFFAVGQ